MKKHRFQLEGFEIIEKVAKKRTDTAYVYLPKNWAEKKIAIIRLE